jgi:hypothetical protein
VEDSCNTISNGDIRLLEVKKDSVKVMALEKQVLDMVLQFHQVFKRNLWQWNPQSALERFPGPKKDDSLPCAPLPYTQN